MARSSGPGGRSTSGRPRRAVVAVVTVVIIAGVFLALTIVPYNVASNQILVSSQAGATTAVSIPAVGWVTVHFSPGAGVRAMHYWMEGSGGMMFDHSMMDGTDAYSFWSWGGTYQCGAGFAASGSGAMTIWVNATWGVL